MVRLPPQGYDGCRGERLRMGDDMLKGRYGVGWMLASWLALAVMLALCVWAAMWITDIIT